MLAERLEARDDFHKGELEALQNETSELETEGIGYNFTLLNKVIRTFVRKKNSACLGHYGLLL